MMMIRTAGPGYSGREGESLSPVNALPVSPFRPVQADPDRKVMRGEKAAPFLVDEGSVCLNCVVNRAGLLQGRERLDQAAEMFQAAGERFAAMPQNLHRPVGSGDLA